MLNFFEWGYLNTKFSSENEFTCMIEDIQFQPSMALHLTVAGRTLRNCLIKVQESRLWTAVKYAKQEIFSLLKTSIKFLTFVEREFLGTDISWTVTGIFVSWFLESFSLHLYLHKWIELFLNSFPWYLYGSGLSVTWLTGDSPIDLLIKPVNRNIRTLWQPT